MNKLLEPLVDAELAELDDFLLDRLGDEDDENDSDPGIFSISGLDGFLTALVSAPTLVTPEHWMPVVWGDYEPEWESESAFEQIIGLIMRHMNTIAATLDEAPHEFEPLFLEREEDGEFFMVVDDWCEGYVRAVALTNAKWRAGGTEIERLLNPIRAFTSVTDWYAHEQASDTELDQLSDAITPSARAIYAFWLQRRLPKTATDKSPWDNARKK